MSQVTKHKKDGKMERISKKISYGRKKKSFFCCIYIDYKTSTAAAGLDWETSKSKYEEITECFQERYPKGGSGANEQEFPNCRNPKVIGNDRVIPKIMRIKASFRKAVEEERRRGGEEERRRGGGRVVSAFYKECIEIWGGSPAVDSFSGGIESSSLSSSCDNCWPGDISATPKRPSSSPNTVTTSPTSNPNQTGSNSVQEEEEGGLVRITEKVGEARHNVISHMRHNKDSRLTIRLSSNAQLVDIEKSGA